MEAKHNHRWRLFVSSLFERKLQVLSKMDALSVPSSDSFLSFIVLVCKLRATCMIIAQQVVHMMISSNRNIPFELFYFTRHLTHMSLPIPFCSISLKCFCISFLEPCNIKANTHRIISQSSARWSVRTVAAFVVKIALLEVPNRHLVQ